MSTDRSAPARESERVAHRLREAGLSTRRFIDVADGKKKTTNHNQREPDDSRLSGNYGIYAGPGADAPDADSWLVDVDIDDYAADDDAREALDAVLALPETLTTETPHTDGETGGHRFYAVTGDVVATMQDVTGGAPNAVPSWGEVRVVNQYVVGPGSQIDGCDKDGCEECATPDGGRYRIADDGDRPIATIAVDRLADVLRADPAYANGGDDAPDAGTDYQPGGETDAETVARKHSWLRDYLALGDDDRSSADFRACCLMIENGVAKADARALLDGSPHTKVSERGSGYWCSTWGRALREADRPEAGDGSDSDGGTSDGTTTSWKEVVSQYRDPDTLVRTANRAAADVLLEEYSTVTERETRAILVYNPDTGVYERDGGIVLQERLVEKLGDEYADNRRREVMSILRGSNVERVGDIGGPEGHICVENGVLDLRPLLEDGEAPELRDHSPVYRFIRSMPVEYDPEADADRWREFVDASAKGDGHLNLQEYVGYCLMTWCQKYKRAAMILGPKDSGKSTFVDTVSELLGWDNVSSENMNSLVNSRWGRAQLRGKYANITSELDAEELENIGRFKTLTGGDRSISAEFKGQPKFTFNPTAKHIYATNQVPPVADADDAFHERMLHVVFPRTVPRVEQDIKLGEKLQNELPGILNWALEGLARLEGQGGFTDDPMVGRKQELWEMYGDSTARFVNACIVETGEPADVIHKDVAYRAYVTFIAETPLQRKEPNTFKSEMNARKNVDDGQIKLREGDRRRRAFTGVRWSPDALETLRELGFDPADELESIIRSEETANREQDDGSGQTAILGAFS